MIRRLPIVAGTDRKHLTDWEVAQLLEATRGSRHAARDRCLLLLMFRHGLRVSEVCRLKLDQVDADSRILHVLRLKRGLSTDHPLRAEELHRRLAEGKGPDEGTRCGENVLHQRAAPAVAPLDRQSPAGQAQRRCVTPARAPAYAPPCLRLCSG